MIVLLPAPVGPTKPIFCPGRATRLTSQRMGTPSTEEKSTCSISTSPSVRSMSAAVALSTISGGSSRISNTRVDPAWACSAMLRIWANWLRGRLNVRAKMKNDATVPTSTVPRRDNQQHPQRDQHRPQVVEQDEHRAQLDGPVDHQVAADPQRGGQPEVDDQQQRRVEQGRGPLGVGGRPREVAGVLVEALVLVVPAD